MAAGIPVFVWSGSALADFVKENKVGYCIESLEDIDKVITNMTNENYLNLASNVTKIQTKIISGHYLNIALTKAMNHLTEVSSPPNIKQRQE